MVLSTRITGTDSIAAARAQLRQIQRLQGRVLIDAVNDSAFAARAALHDEAARVLDRPTPYLTRNAWIVLKARPTPNRSTALIVPRNTPGSDPRRRHRIFRTLIEGGDRDPKGFEEALASLGRGLPPGTKLVPTRAIRLDSRGNVPPARIRSLIAGARAGTVWIGRLGNTGPAGVWELRRVAGRGRPRPVLVMIAKRRFSYRPDTFSLDAGVEAIERTFAPATQRRLEQRLSRLRP